MSLSFLFRLFLISCLRFTYAYPDNAFCRWDIATLVYELVEAAIGISLRNPRKKFICFTQDGVISS